MANMRHAKQQGGGYLSKGDRQVRDELIFLKRLAGQKIAEIGKEFGITEQRVSQVSREVRNGRIGTLAQDMVLQRLLPRAIAVMEAEMEAGGERAVEVAMKIVDATKIMSPVTPAGTQVVEEFEAFRRRVVTSTPPTPFTGDVIDVDTSDSRSSELAYLGPAAPDGGSGGIDPDDPGGGAESVGGDVSSGSNPASDEGLDPRGRDVKDAPGAEQVHGPGVEDPEGPGSAS